MAVISIYQQIFIVLFSLLFSVVLGYIFIKINWPDYLYDFPNHRKIHQNPTLKVGGSIIWSTLLVTSLLFGLFHNMVYIYYFLICTLFYIVGHMDDMFEWSYKRKFAYQIIGTVLVLMVMPINISRITFSSIDLQVPWLNFILITFWIVTIINSFNFIDGINKLAGSIAIIILISYYLMFRNQQNNFALDIYLILIFSILGFLVYNKTPAKIFMGDGGSLFLGFIIATIPLIHLSSETSGINITRPALITSILVMDTFYLILSRIKNKKSPFSPNKDHLHHHLLNMNFKSRTVVYIILSFTIAVNILAYYSKSLSFYQIILIELLIFGIIIALPRRIRSNNLRKSRYPS